MAGEDGKASSSTAKPAEPQDVVVRIIKAELYRNFEMGGKMDPYATAVLHTSSSRDKAWVRTKTDWNAHMTPVWNHICPNHPFEKGSGIEVEFKVFEDDVVGTDDLCGSHRVLLDDLVGDDNEVLGRIKEYPLNLKGEVTGALFIQATLVLQGRGASDEEELSRIEAERFHSPVSRIGVSGGTAPFFKLKLKQPAANQSAGHFIGKDLSHARDEVGFYEQMHRIEKAPGGLAVMPVLKFCTEYEGVAACEIEGAKPDEKTKDLLVLRNLFDGATSLRMLDIKIGQKTAAAGWQGKSRLAALRQSVVDGLTNSAAEGFRLEGFDGLTPVLKSMDPLMDFGGAKKEKTAKKAFRFMLQKLAGHEMLMHLFDVHQIPEDSAEAEIKTRLSPEELAEITLSEIVERLIRLSLNCRLTPVPQKWIGSSVALAFDAGPLPARNTEDKIRQAVKVNIFDWGRSELLTFEKNSQLNRKAQKDRSQFWGYYVGGIDRLSFEAARLYWNRFGNASAWKEIHITLFDFDSATANDFIGKLTITDFKDETRKCVKLVSNKNREVQSNSTPSTLTYSLVKRTYPAGSRLKFAWRLTLHEARDLPKSDRVMLKSTSDPFMECVAISQDGKMYKQMTSVKQSTLNPTWNETMEFPIAAKPGVLEETLGNVNSKLSDGLDKLLLPDESARAAKDDKLVKGSVKNEDEAMTEWEERLDIAAMTYDVSHPPSRSLTSSAGLAAASQASAASEMPDHSARIQALRSHRGVMRSGTDRELPTGDMNTIMKEQVDESLAVGSPTQPSSPVRLAEPVEILPSAAEPATKGDSGLVPVEEVSGDIKKVGQCQDCRCSCM